MKILIFTKNWLGDVLFQLPSIEAIRARYPEAEIVCIAAKRCHEILKAHPAVNRVILFDEKNEHRPWLKRMGFAFELRREKWDKAYLLHNSKTRAFLLFLAGVRERVGYSTKRKWFLTTPVEEPLLPIHQVDYFLHLLSQDGFPVPQNPAYRFYFSSESEQSALQILQQNQLKSQGYACFHLGANWEPKRWPVFSSAKLADLIHQKWGIPIVVTGGEGDKHLIEAMLKEIKHARVISLVGQTGLQEAGALFKHALFVVSGDSGPMHIASGMGARLIALFGPTCPLLTGPRGIGDKVIFKYVPKNCKAPWFSKNSPEGGWLPEIQPEPILEVIEEKKWHQPMNGFSGYTELCEIRGETGRKSIQLLQAIPTSPNHVQDILFVTLSNIGDVILTTPVLMALVEKFPHTRITVVVGPRAEEVLSESCYPYRVLVYDKKASLLDKKEFMRCLWAQTYDYVVDLRNTAIPYLVKAKKRSPLFRRFHQTGMRERHLEILTQMGLPTRSEKAFDFFHEKDEASVLEKIKNKGLEDKKGWILVAPVAASNAKTWSVGGYAEVVRALLKEYDRNILIVGDGKTKEAGERLAQINPNRIFNLAGETNLRELAAVVSRCSLLLCNDSAVMHLGHEFNRSVVALFGPTNHQKYGRTGPHFRIVRQPAGCLPCKDAKQYSGEHTCMDNIPAHQVYEVCKELLNQKSEVVNFLS